MIKWATPAEWVEALESGRFEKGRDRLVTFGDEQYPNDPNDFPEGYADLPRTYCCLGVLAEISGYPIETLTPDQWYLRYEVDNGRNNIGDGPDWLLPGHERTLSALNDNSDTFELVIQQIKATYLWDNK